MTTSSAFFFIFLFVLPILAAVYVYRLDDFEPVPYPAHELIQKPLFVPKRNSHMLKGAERIAEGKVWGPEDIAYDPKNGVIYTGTHDGWLTSVTVNDSAADVVAEQYINTGGRPLGVVNGLNGDIFIADAATGLMRVSDTGVIELLTEEAEGLRFNLTDGLDIAPDGTVYFTDASYSYGLEVFYTDLLLGKPHGRLLSYNTSTLETKVLLKDLYFPNGVTLSADKTAVIFCETPMKRCKKYYIDGPKKGSVDAFVENLPGLPDNIRYDGEGQYWIALATDAGFWSFAQRYPFLRKIVGLLKRHTELKFEKNGGAVAVDLDGKPTVHYYDRNASSISAALKIGDHLYLGSLELPYLLRLNLTQYPAT